MGTGAGPSPGIGAASSGPPGFLGKPGPGGCRRDLLPARSPPSGSGVRAGPVSFRNDSRPSPTPPFPLAAPSASDYPRGLVKTGLAAIRGRLEDVRERVARAIERSGRAPGSVRLVAVVKTLPADQVVEAVSLGVADLGESRVQEAEAHLEALGRRDARWHLIGHLQRNKAGRAARAFDR